MAQTLKFGNKTWATKVGSTLAYNDENGNYKPLPFAFTRSTSATRVNKEGLIEVVTNDRPRIDYTDTSDGVLLLEKAATNLITYSQDFSNSIWNQGATRSVTFVPTNTIDPQGQTNAYRITSTASDNQVAALASIVSGQIYNNSIYVKRVSGSGSVILRNVNNQENTFQLSVSDGWKRIDTTATSTSTFGRLYINLETIGDEIEIWGAQLELGNISSYIPTQGSATTRVAETASDSGNSEVFNDSEGVLFADIAANANDGTSRYIAISDGSNNERVQIIYSSISDNIAMSVVSSNTGQASTTAITSQIQYSKLAILYKVNNCSFWFNGFKIHTDTSAVMPSGLNVLEYQRPNNTSQFYGKTKEIGYYNTILTDLELETLTSYKSWTSMVNELNLNIIYNG